MPITQSVNSTMILANPIFRAILAVVDRVMLVTPLVTVTPMAMRTVTAMVMRTAIVMGGATATGMPMVTVMDGQGVSRFRLFRIPGGLPHADSDTLCL